VVDPDPIPNDDPLDVKQFKALLATVTPEALDEAAAKLKERAKDLRKKAKGLEDLADRATALSTLIQGAPTP
jgi:hypothetical protein